MATYPPVAAPNGALRQKANRRVNKTPASTCGVFGLHQSVQFFFLSSMVMLTNTFVSLYADHTNDDYCLSA